jgi:hypothetical protein
MIGFFFSPDRIFQLGPRRGFYFIVFSFFFIATEIGREIYRPYIYRNAIDDLGFADVVGNLLGTIAIIFFQLAVLHATRAQGFRIIALVTVGVTLYELSQSFLPRGVLDWKDVVSTPIAGVVSLGLLLFINKIIPDPLSLS